jgi:hypothetical protein
LDIILGYTLFCKEKKGERGAKGAKGTVLFAHWESRAKRTVPFAHCTSPKTSSALLSQSATH